MSLPARYSMEQTQSFAMPPINLRGLGKKAHLTCECVFVSWPSITPTH